MGSIRKRGNTYQAQVRLSGGRHASKSFKTRSEATNWSREAAYHLSQEPERFDERVTLRDVIRRFIKDTAPLRRSGVNEAIRLNTISRHAISSIPVSKITSSDLSKYRDMRLKTIKSNTLHREFGLLRVVVGKAKDEWRMDIPNPFESFHIKKEPDHRQRRVHKGEIDLLMLTPCRSLLTKPAMIVALETSMRLGEILSIKWDKIDFGRGFVELERSKNGRGRIIPLTNTALMTFEALPRDGLFVFPVKPDTLKQSWRRLVKRAGIHDLRFHDLRHEAISRLLEMGLTIPEAASVSGHRTASMLARYAHPDPVKVREKMLR